MLLFFIGDKSLDFTLYEILVYKDVSGVRKSENINRTLNRRQNCERTVRDRKVYKLQIRRYSH